MNIWIEQKPRLSWNSDFTEELFERLGPNYNKLSSPIVLTARFVFYSVSPRTRVPTQDPSLRGLLGGLLDVLCGYAWEDERQLVAVHASKEYGNVSGVQIKW